MKLENIVNILLNKIPEFVSSPEFFECKDDQEFPYVIFGRFVDFVIRTFEEHGEMKNIVSLLEEMANEKDSKVIELLMFGFLENLNPKKSYYNNLTSLFGVKTKQRLQETIDHNNIINS